MRKGFFNKKWYMSIVSLLFVAIIPLCSINLYNYSQVLSTTSQEETLDDEQNNVVGGIDTSENNDDDEDVTTQASGYWTDYATEPKETSSGSRKYYIYTAAELAWLINNQQIYAQFYLGANIDLSDHYWVPIKDFYGTLDGNGYTISGMSIVNDYSYGIGLIGNTQYYSLSTIIRDLIVSGSINVYVDSSNRGIGGIVGEFESYLYSSIQNCVSKVNILVNAGVYAWSSHEADNVSVGGIVGAAPDDPKYNAGEGIIECINFGDITLALDADLSLFSHKEYHAGGIVGKGNFKIYDCVNHGDIKSDGKYNGGIIGLLLGFNYDKRNQEERYLVEVVRCLNFGNVTTRSDKEGNNVLTGGIAGQASFAWIGTKKSYSEIRYCVNFGTIKGHSTSWKESCGIGQIAGWLGGWGTWISNCYYKLSTVDPVGEVRDSDYRTNLGYDFYNVPFNEYSSLFGSAYYDNSSLASVWTGMNFYSSNVTTSTCPNSSRPVTLSWFVKDMEIDVKIWEDDKLVDFKGNDFYLDSANNGLDMSLSCLYNFYSTITTSRFNAFKMANNGRYTVTVYEKDTSEENDLGRVIIDPTTNTVIEYAMTGSGLDEGTYSSNFTDIIIVLEPEEKIVPISIPGFEVYTTDELYNGSNTIPGNLQLSYDGGTIEVNSTDEVFTRDTVLTVTITANPGYEFIGLFADDDLFISGSLDSRRIEHFNDLSYDEYLDDIPEEEIENMPNIPAERVSMTPYDSYAKYVYTFKIGNLITGMEVEAIEDTEKSSSGQDEVSANRRDNLVHVTIIGGGGGGSSSGGGNSSYDDQKQEDENKEEEEKFKYIIKSISYVSTFDVVFVPYRLSYDLSVSYQGAGFDMFNLEKGFRDRARLAERGSYTPYFYNAGTTTLATSLTLESGSDYFSSSSFVEYVADVSGAVEGYWSSSYGSSVSGMSFIGSYVRLTPSSFFAYADPWSYTTITFKYCESPRYDYTYTIYITDAYEEYGTGQYLPGQLVGETDYYASSKITKQNISVRMPDGTTAYLPATTIPTAATYREEFNFNRNNVLSSDFISGLVDTSMILSAPSTSVGGRSINIYSTLSGVAPRYDKEPITGYKIENPYYLTNNYSLANTSNLTNTSLRSILSTYGNLSSNGSSITLYNFYHIRDTYNVVFKTYVNGIETNLNMPANSDEYILTANGSNMTSNSLDFTCEPFDLINVDVTDKLVYRYDGQKTTFYSFDCMTVGDSVLSESGTYSFQGIPTNDIEEFVIAVNFKEEFTIDNRILNSDTSISYNSSIWYVDSATDLLNIAYRVYCQGLPLAKKIVQTADIDFEGGYMLPIGTESQPFSSVYDGQYYRIENMSIVGGTADDIGLFGYAVGATIKNLTLMNADVSGGYNVGAVAGYATNTTFERVGSYNGIVSAMDVQTAGRGIFLTNGVTAVNVTKQNGTYTSISLGNNGTSYTVLSVMVADEIVNDSDRAYYIGDLIGRGDNVTIKICFVRKSNTINAEIGGFAGLLENSQVTNAYTSRSDFGNTIGTTLTHTHTDITDISTCPDCDDVFIW